MPVLDLINILGFMLQNNLLKKNVIDIYNKWILHTKKKYTMAETEWLIRNIKKLKQIDAETLKKVYQIDTENIKTLKGDLQ